MVVITTAGLLQGAKLRQEKQEQQDKIEAENSSLIAQTLQPVSLLGIYNTEIVSRWDMAKGLTVF